MLERYQLFSPFSLFFLLAAGGAAVLMFALLTVPILIAGLVGGCVALCVALALFKHPMWSLFAFVLILPFHSLLMTILLAQVGLPVEGVRAAAAWKEALLIVTVLILFLRILARQRLSMLTLVDGIALLWLMQILFYFVIGSLIPTWQPSWEARLYGARDWLLYLLPYFIGRLIAVSDRTAQRILQAILLVGVVTSLYGIFEYLFLPIDFHVQLGVPRYFSEFLGLSYPDYMFGLPPNYWAEVAGQQLRRSVSTHLNGQGFAVPFLLIMPVATVHYFYQPARKNQFALIACLIALLLTITRMTIIVCFIQGLVILFVLRRYKLLMGILLFGLLLFAVALIASVTFRTYVADTIFLRDTSASARPAQWVNGTQAILERPFGAGLGYAGQVGTRFGGSGEGQEAGYFKITGDLGIPGLLFFLAWFLGLLLYSLNLFRTTAGVWKMLALSTFVTAIGFMLNNITAPPDQSPFLIYVFPFLAGITVHQYRLQRLARFQSKCAIPGASSLSEYSKDVNTLVPIRS